MECLVCGGGGFLKEKTSEIAQLDHISPESENCSGRSVRSFHRSVRFPVPLRSSFSSELQNNSKGAAPHFSARAESLLPAQDDMRQDIMAALTNLFLRADGKVGRGIHVRLELVLAWVDDLCPREAIQYSTVC